MFVVPIENGVRIENGVSLYIAKKDVSCWETHLFLFRLIIIACRLFSLAVCLLSKQS